jgi:hypothetical protein
VEKLGLVPERHLAVPVDDVVAHAVVLEGHAGRVGLHLVVVDLFRCATSDATVRAL